MHVCVCASIVLLLIECDHIQCTYNKLDDREQTLSLGDPIADHQKIRLLPY